MQLTPRSVASVPAPTASVSAPARHGTAFWLLFALGAAWGAVLGSMLVGKPLAWFIAAIVPAAEHAGPPLVHGLDAASRTPAGAPLIVLAFTLGSAFLVASGGMNWLEERAEEQAYQRMLRARPGRARRRVAWPR